MKNDSVPVKGRSKCLILLDLKCIILSRHKTNTCLNQIIKEGQTSLGTSMFYTL